MADLAISRDFEERIDIVASRICNQCTGLFLSKIFKDLSNTFCKIFRFLSFCSNQKHFKTTLVRVLKLVIICGMALEGGQTTGGDHTLKVCKQFSSSKKPWGKFLC